MTQLSTRWSKWLDGLWALLSIGLALDVIWASYELDAEAWLYFGLHLLTGLLFLFRFPPRVHAAGWRCYLLASLSTVYVYAYDFHETTALAHWGRPLLLGSTMLCFGALVSLGRCFGVLPICRGVQTKGLYRLVRHPVYASYILMDVGLVVSWFSLRNLLLFLLGCGLFLRRIHDEEALLRRFAPYREYAAAVRFRLFPLVY